MGPLAQCGQIQWNPFESSRISYSNLFESTGVIVNLLRFFGDLLGRPAKPLVIHHQRPTMKNSLFTSKCETRLMM